MGTRATTNKLYTVQFEDLKECIRSPSENLKVHETFLDLPLGGNEVKNANLEQSRNWGKKTSRPKGCMAASESCYLQY